MNNEFYLSDAIEVIDEILSSGGEFRMYPKGTSMLPLIVQGKDSVVLRRSAEPLKKHDIAFYKRDNGQFVLHRVMKVGKNGVYTMCGDNQTALENVIRQEQIIGYVAGIYKEDAPLNESSFKYRAYIFFWCFMPYRCSVRFVKRAIRKTGRILSKIFSKKD